MQNLPVHILGFGPAATGLFVAADRLGSLDALLAAGLVLHEALTPEGLGRQGMCYDISSNTPGSSFLTGIRADGIFAPSLQSPAGIALRQAGPDPVDLRLASAFMAELRAIIIRTGVEIRWQSRVAAVQQTDSGWHLPGTGGAVQVVLASGSTPWLPPALAARADVLHAEAFLRPDAAVPQGGGPVTVIGSSHSALSVVAKLRHLMPDRPVRLLSRSPVRRSWPSMLEARAAGEAFDPIRDVCPTTGAVYLLGGLHARARDLWTAIERGEFPQVTWARLEADAWPESGPIIAATGYRPRLPLLLDAAGQAIRLEQNGAWLDHSPQSGGWPLQGLHAIGHGLGFRPPQLGEASSRAGLASFAWFAGPEGQALCQGLRAAGGKA